jgi:hypothetical protein
MLVNAQKFGERALTELGPPLYSSPRSDAEFSARGESSDAIN